MEKVKYWPELKNEVDAILLNHPLVKEGKMFGYPAYYVNKKLAICHYHEGLAMKNHEDLIQTLQNNPLIASEPFCPMGKKMGNNWIIFFPEEAQQIKVIENMLIASIEFVADQSVKSIKSSRR